MKKQAMDAPLEFSSESDLEEWFAANGGEVFVSEDGFRVTYDGNTLDYGDLGGAWRRQASADVEEAGGPGSGRKKGNDDEEDYEGSLDEDDDEGTDYDLEDPDVEEASVKTAVKKTADYETTAARINFEGNTYNAQVEDIDGTPLYSWENEDGRLLEMFNGQVDEQGPGADNIGIGIVIEGSVKQADTQSPKLRQIPEMIELDVTNKYEEIEKDRELSLSERADTSLLEEDEKRKGIASVKTANFQAGDKVEIMGTEIAEVISYGSYESLKQYDESGAAVESADDEMVAVRMSDGSTAVYNDDGTVDKI